MEMAVVIMNPVRQRIFQYLLVHETCTVQDIPSASLYRHMKLLTDSAVLAIAGENRVRGTVESIYRLNRSALEIDDTDGAGIQTALLGTCASFAKYFASGHADPRRDLLLLTTCTLTLTDEEFTAFLSELDQVAVRYMGLGVSERSKTRQVTLISVPSDGQVAQALPPV